MDKRQKLHNNINDVTPRSLIALVINDRLFSGIPLDIELKLSPN